MKTLVLYAHPGQQHSNTNKAMAKAAKSTSDVTLISDVDASADYRAHLAGVMARRAVEACG